MSENLSSEIIRLKKERNAVVLAHYYQLPEVQEIADYVGDSYYLSKIAKDSSENTIVFCGVKFMAESAKILSPEKTILLPSLEAGCPMANMATAHSLLELKAKHPKAKVVCYINSTAEVKAVSDVCCTSSNALKIVQSIDADEIIFVPDKNLGAYIAEQVKDKKMILWDGFCVTHNKIHSEEVLSLKNFYKDIKVLVHPECAKEVRDLADFLGSTGEIISYATENSAKDYLVVTELGVVHELQKRNPNKNFYTLERMVCPNMKRTSLENVYEALRDLKHEINVEENIRIQAYKSLENMHLLGR